MTGHTIQLSIGPGSLESVEFRCHEPDGADCRKACERSECEEGCRCRILGQEPIWHDFSECLVCTWLDNSGLWDELYDGPIADVRSGPIAVQWNGECYTWRYREGS